MQIKKRIDPIAGISFITAACLIGDSMLYVVLPLHFLEAGLNNLWEVGAILSVNRFVRLPLNPLVGWLYHRLNLRTGILFAAILALLSTISYAFLQCFYLWLFARCIWGLAWTFLRLGAYFTIMDASTDENRGKSMGRYNGLYRLGSLVGMLFGGFIADAYGLQTTALLFGLVTFCAIPLAFFMLASSSKTFVSKENNTDQTLSIRCIFKELHIIWALSAGMFIAMIYQGMFTSTLSYLVEAHYAKTVNLYGWLIGAASLSGILQALRWGWEPFFAPWFGKKTDGSRGRYPIFAVSLLVGGILFALIPQSMPILLWLILILGIQLTATSLTTIADAIASDVAMTSSKITVMTLYSLFIDLGAAAGPFLAYLMNQYIGPYAACSSASILLFAMAIRALFQTRNAKS